MMQAQILAAASHGVTALTDSSGAAARRGEIGHVGEGVWEGGRALGQNILRGATGMFTKPMEGASKGIGGFLGGMAKVGAGVGLLEHPMHARMHTGFLGVRLQVCRCGCEGVEMCVVCSLWTLHAQTHQGCEVAGVEVWVWVCECARTSVCLDGFLRQLLGLHHMCLHMHVWSCVCVCACACACLCVYVCVRARAGPELWLHTMRCVCALACRAWLARLPARSEGP